jgi:N-methylhydantoinase A
MAYFEEAGGYVDTPIYARGALAVGDELAGPAIVEQPDTTFVIYPGHTATLDASNNLVVSVPAPADAAATEAVAS